MLSVDMNAGKASTRSTSKHVDSQKGAQSVIGRRHSPSDINASLQPWLELANLLPPPSSHKESEHRCRRSHHRRDSIGSRGHRRDGKESAPVNGEWPCYDRLLTAVVRAGFSFSVIRKGLRSSQAGPRSLARRRHLRKFRERWIHMVPRLGT